MPARRKSPDTTAREYLRVSLDRSGRARSTGEQHDENARAAEAQGWALGEPYVDNDISASRYSTKARGDFAKLLDDLGHGRYGAGVLMLWESSRGSRKVGEWVELIELCEQAKVRIHVTTHARTYDPGNARDRRSLLEDAVDSEFESGKLSARMQRAHAAGAEQGRPAGIAPYGYTRFYDPKTRQLVAQEIVPAEAKIVREVYDRLHKGHSLRAVAADLNSRGVRTRNGKPFVGPGLRQLVLQPVYAAYRSHQPGKKHGNGYRSLDGVTLTDGQWPPIVSREVWWAVRRRLTDPKRVTTRPGGVRHLLTVMPEAACCHHCEQPLTSTNRFGHEELQCLPGCVRIDEAALTGYVEQVVLAYLRQPDLLDELRRGEHRNDDALRTLRDQLGEARGELVELRAGGKTGRLTVATLLEVEPGLVAKVEDLEQRERELSAPPALAALITPGKDVRRRWKAAPVSARRDVARLLLRPPVLGQLRVTRSPSPGHRVAIERRVIWRRDDGDHPGVPA